MTMKRMKWLALAVLIGGFAALAAHGEDPDKDKVSSLMKRKLTASQKVLEGLAVIDFKAIAQNAEELIAISKEAEWKVIKSPRYEVYSNDFRRIADDLVKQSNEKNVDAAALSYVELTLTCVKCHKHVRESRWAMNE
jgi:hypothetical protein